MFLFKLALIVLLLTPQIGKHEPQTQPRNRSRQTSVQNANSQPTDRAIQQSSPQVNNETETASQSQQQERDAKEQTSKEEQLTQNRIVVAATVWIAVFGGLSFLAALIYAIVAMMTLRSVKEQARHAGEQVREMQKTSETMNAQLGTMNQQADVMKRQLEAMAISERAYLTVENITINPIKQDGVLTITADLANAGRTPAFNLTSKTQTTMHRFGDTVRPITEWEKCLEDTTASMLAAAGKIHIDFAPVPGMTQQIADFLNSGHYKLFIDAQYRYLDFIGTPQILEIGYVFEFEDERSRAVMLYQSHRAEESTG